MPDNPSLEVRLFVRTDAHKEIAPVTVFEAVQPGDIDVFGPLERTISALHPQVALQRTQQLWPQGDDWAVSELRDAHGRFVGLCRIHTSTAFWEAITANINAQVRQHAAETADRPKSG